MNVYILCPSGSTTGGVESLHQFGHALRRAGGSAFMSFLPEPGGGGTAEHFRDYGVPAAEPLDAPGNVVVVPELMTSLAREYPRSTRAIFWLSVDNYLYRKHRSQLADWYRRVRSLMTTRLPVRRMRGFVHLSQSRYATDFLAGHGLESLYVGDYLADAFFEDADQVLGGDVERRDQVAFNPAKGRKHVERLRRRRPDFAFTPIVGMTRDQVIRTLAASKVYLDLGHHPGRDRIPREAAALGCCVITSRRGSAENPVDVPIPAEYKFDLDGESLARIPAQIEKVFESYEREAERFGAYRDQVRGDKQRYLEEAPRWLAFLESSVEKDRRHAES